MDRQIRRFKGKVYKSYQARKSAKADRARLEASTTVQQVMADDESPPFQELGSVVRTKRFRMEPKTANLCDTIDRPRPVREARSAF